MKTLVRMILAALLSQPVMVTPSFSEVRGKGSTEKCRVLLGKWMQAGDSHHMRKVLNKRSKVEKKMDKLDCPPPTA